jgi:thioredoxin reductase
MGARNVVVIGAGPAGLEAALHAARAGHDVRVLEAGRIGENVLRWGHVRLFSPFEMNRSTLGRAVLAESGVTPPPPGAYLTGREHVEAYLVPLARSLPLAGRVHESTRVVQIGREGLSKSAPLGEARGRAPFLVLVDRPRGESVERADVVIDASGTYGQPNWLGDGNVPAPGERALAHRIDYRLVDIASDPERFAGRQVLVAGSGYSAATALDALGSVDGVDVTWIARRAEREPYAVRGDDPLPERARLGRLGNELARGADRRVRFLAATAVERIDECGARLAVTLRGPAGRETIEVDRVLAHVGFTPDNSLYRELQVHECYASFGPMRLAAALLEEPSGDCLAQASQGAESLVQPEPGFFLLGAKSYGRNSSFLMRVGIEQARDVRTLVS